MAEYFVATTGNDGNPGTLAQPFATIAHGLGQLAAGDMLHIRTGTYAAHIHESMLVTGTSAAPIMIDAYVGEVVTLRPSAQCKVVRFETSARSYITLRGLNFDQSLATCTTEPVVSIDGAQSHLTLESCDIINGAANGITLAGSDHRLTDLLVRDNDGSGIDASAASTSLLVDIESRNNGSHGALIGASNSANRLSLHNNGGDGLRLSGAASATNCVAYLNTGAGINVTSGSGAKVYQATAAKNSGAGIVIASGVSAASVRNSIAWANTGTAIDDLGTSTTLLDNLTTNPNFVDESGNNFRLLATSAAIDTGGDLSGEEVNDDYDGAPRPIGAAYDKGAYEYFSESAPDPGSGTGSAIGQATVVGLGEFLSTEGVGAASGDATVVGLGEFLSTEGTGSAIGQATVVGLGQFVINAESVNPKRFTLRVTEAHIGANRMVELDLVREDLAIYQASGLAPVLGADVLGGVPVAPAPSTDLSDASSPGSTRVVFLDIPQLSADTSSPGFYAAASGIHDDWRGALLYKKVGGEFVEIAQFGERGVIGNADNRLATGPTTIFDGSGRTFVWDDTNTVDITLIDSQSELVSVTDDAVLAGTNAIALGYHGRWEILAFGTATQLAPRKYRLSHLLRGLKGTEWAVNSHGIGDLVVLLESALRRVADEYVDIGIARDFRAVSVGNPADIATELSFIDTGVSLKPLSPVYIRGEEDSEKNRVLRCYPRSRVDGLAGRDGVAAPPLDEPTLNLEWDVFNIAGTSVVRTLKSSTEYVGYSRQEQFVDHGSIPTSLKVKVYQISATIGRGYAGEATISSFSAATLPPDSVTDRPYRLKCTVRRPLPGGILIHDPVTDRVFFGAGLTKCRGKVRTAPLATAVFSIKRNDVEFGTMTFSAGQTVATFAAAADVIFDPATSDILTVVGPSPEDETLLNLGFTLHGERI